MRVCLCNGSVPFFSLRKLPLPNPHNKSTTISACYCMSCLIATHQRQIDRFPWWCRCFRTTNSIRHTVCTPCPQLLSFEVEFLDSIAAKYSYCSVPRFLPVQTRKPKSITTAAIVCSSFVWLYIKINTSTIVGVQKLTATVGFKNMYFL
jgi:hypothetical protein